MVDTIRSSWRDVLPIHPAADLFPLMSPDELKALGEDIKVTGLTSAVVLWRDNVEAEAVLLDGRNRLDAIEAAIGRPVHVDDEEIWIGNSDIRWHDLGVTIIGPPFDPYTFVVSANIHRRHLTAEQKRDLIAELLKASPEKSNRQIAEAVKVDHKTVAAVRAEKVATGEIPQLTKTVGKDGKARKQQPLVKKKRRDVDDYLADKRAKKITETTAVLPTESERQFAVPVLPTESERQFALLKSLWGINNTLRAAWERSSPKAQRRFIRWLDGGARDEEEAAQEAKAM
jgi:hypothetical protein